MFTMNMLSLFSKIVNNFLRLKVASFISNLFCIATNDLKMESPGII